MKRNDIDFTGEVSRVHWELTALRDAILPEFFEPDEVSIPPPPGRPEEHVARAARITLRDWQQAIDRLRDALPLSGWGRPPGPRLSAADPELDWADYKEFQWVGTTVSYSIHQRRIIWRIELFVTWDYALGYMLTQSETEHSFDELRQRLPEVKRWFLALPPDGSVLFNALSYVLTPVADLDPVFVKLALDPETWRSIARTDQTLDEATRAKRLEAIDSGHLPHAINNALLHVLAALANNHFPSIMDYLDHPCLWGGYTGLMPYYFFAVLLEKVKTLRSLARLADG